MILYRNVRRALASRHVYTPKFTIQRFYKSNADPSPGLKRTQGPKELKKELATEFANAIRGLMRKQPNGLAAVVAPSVSFDVPPLRTQRQSPESETPEMKSALLVSSLNTVTLSPMPYISFNIKTPSLTYDYIRRFGSFMVSGLDKAATARAFAKGEAEELDPSAALWRRLVDSKGRVKSICGGTWWVKCKFRSKLSSRVGDHMVVVAAVLEVGSLRKDNPGKNLAEALIYLDGKYRYVNADPVNSIKEELELRRQLGVVKQPSVLPADA